MHPKTYTRTIGPKGVHQTLSHLPAAPTIFIPDDAFANPSSLPRLGRGAFGQVYKYTDQHGMHSIALKCLPIISDGLGREIDDIMQEVAVHGALLHNNIVHYIGCYFSKENLFILLEYMENGSLKDLLKKLDKERIANGTGYRRNEVGEKSLLSSKDIMRYTCNVLKGLKFLHANGVIHRDLRSPNILLSSNDVAKIADFGLSEQINSLATSSGFTAHPNIGNVFFRAPEMIDTEGRTKIGGRAVDIWSLGILILEMVYNVLPFARERGSEVPYMFKLCVRKELPDVPDFVSHQVACVLRKCLVYDADKRSTPEELLEELFSLDVNGRVIEFALDSCNADDISNGKHSRQKEEDYHHQHQVKLQREQDVQQMHQPQYLEQHSDESRLSISSEEDEELKLVQLRDEYVFLKCDPILPLLPLFHPIFQEIKQEEQMQQNRKQQQYEQQGKQQEHYKQQQLYKQQQHNKQQLYKQRLKTRRGSCNNG